MASSINASTSGAGGVITTADNSGILNLQSNGTTVATVSSTGFSTPANQTINTANTFGFKNRIINGDFRISQYNGTSSVTLTNSSSYTIDRYFTNRIGGAATFTVQQSTTAPAGFINSYQVTVGTGAVPSGSDEGCFGQPIEGLNVADFGLGTANAKTFTLSFWVRSSVTGTFGVTFFNSAFNRSYVTSYVINAANTWEQKTITVAGDTSGTWLTTNGRGLCVNWDLGTGSTYSASASSSWQAGGYEGLTGGTKLASTAGATWYITGVQLEVGSQATSFDFRSYNQEFLMCQRYLQTIGGSASNQIIATTWAFGPNNCLAACLFPVPMRTIPSLSYSAVADWSLFNGGAGGPYTCATIALNRPSNTSMSIEMTSPGVFTAGQAGSMLANTTNARLFFSAEL